MDIVRTALLLMLTFSRAFAFFLPLLSLWQSRFIKIKDKLNNLAYEMQIVALKNERN